MEAAAGRERLGTRDGQRQLKRALHRGVRTATGGTEAVRTRRVPFPALKPLPLLNSAPAACALRACRRGAGCLYRCGYSALQPCRSSSSRSQSVPATSSRRHQGPGGVLLHELEREIANNAARQRCRTPEWERMKRAGVDSTARDHRMGPRASRSQGRNGRAPTALVGAGRRTASTCCPSSSTRPAWARSIRARGASPPKDPADYAAS